MTTVDEFYKVGPGPSSSHTIGPMRITYDFYQRCTKLPAAQLAQATALKVHLFGSLSATGKGHGTERAALAGHHRQGAGDDRSGLPRRARRQPEPDLPGDARRRRPFNASLADIIYDAPKGDFPHPNTMTVQADGRRQGAAGAGILFGRRRLHRMEGLHAAARRARRKYPYQTMAEVLAHAKRDNISVAQLAMANEIAISGKSEAEINAFLDKILGAMRATVKTGLEAPTGVLPGPIKLKTKAGDVYRSAPQQGRPRRSAAIGLVSAYALAGSEENARGHLVDHRADRRLGRRDAGGRLFARRGGRASCPTRRSARACSPARWSAISCKHNATLSARRRRLPGGDRRRLGDGRGDDRPGL